MKKYSKNDVLQICDSMMEWAAKAKQISFMQFFLTPIATRLKLTKHKFRELFNQYEEVQDAFFFAKCLMVDKIVSSKDIYKIMHYSAVIRYLRLYDDFLRDNEHQENLERNIALGISTYFTEDYSKEELKDEFAKIHAKNLAKVQNRENPILKKNEYPRKKSPKTV